MENECKIAYSKAKELIQRNKENYGNIKPKIQSFDDGNILVQYFNDWENHWDKTKMKNFQLLDEIDSISNAKLIFSESNNEIQVQLFKKNMIYIVLNGEIDFKFEDGSIKKVSSYEVCSIPKGTPHGGLTVRDTYVLIIEN